MLAPSPNIAVTHRCHNCRTVVTMRVVCMTRVLAADWEGQQCGAPLVRVTPRHVTTGQCDAARHQHQLLAEMLGFLSAGSAIFIPESIESRYQKN